MKYINFMYYATALQIHTFIQNNSSKSPVLWSDILALKISQKNASIYIHLIKNVTFVFQSNIMECLKELCLCIQHIISEKRLDVFNKTLLKDFMNRGFQSSNTF